MLLEELELCDCHTGIIAVGRVVFPYPKKGGFQRPSIRLIHYGKSGGTRTKVVGLEEPFARLLYLTSSAGDRRLLGGAGQRSRL